MRLKYQYTLLYTAALGILFSVSTAAEAQIAPTSKRQRATLLQLDSDVVTGRLANGFTYFLRHNETPKNRVLLYLVNKVGSTLENEDQRGLAHFMEHMSFNGTTHFPHNELVNYLQKSGVRFGADINAYTSFDETVYELPLPADNPEILKNGLQIMRDWAQNATLDPIEINKERGVVLEEKRLGKGAKERLQRVYYPIILNNSRYAERVPIGTDEVLNNFEPEALRRFYRDWYRPDLQALIVVGDIDMKSMERAIRERFADLKNPKNETPRQVYTVSLNGKNQFIPLTDKELTSADIQVLYKFPETSVKTTEGFRAQLIQTLFNKMISTRLAELSRQSTVPFISANASIENFIGGLAVYRLDLTAQSPDLEKGFKMLWRENERIKKFGFTQSELDRAKQAYKNQLILSLEEASKTNSATYVNEYLRYFLKGTPAPGIKDEAALADSLLPGISLSDFSLLANQIVMEKDRDVIVSGPERDKAQLPSEDVFETWIKNVNKEQITPYQDQTIAGTLLSEQPKKGAILSKKKDTGLNLTFYTLSNGAKVIVKPTDFKNDEIRLYGFAPGGTSLYSDDDFPSASNANLVPLFGVGNLNINQLKKALSGKQINVQPFINTRTEGINAISTQKDIGNALELLYAYFTEPRKDTLIFKSIIERSLAAISHRSSDPASVYQDTVNAVLGAHSIRNESITPTVLKKVDLDKAYNIYKERFADASGFIFIIVGNTEEDKLEPLLEKYIASLPATYQHQEAKNLHLNIPAGVIERTIYKGSEPKATVNLVFSGHFDYSFENKFRLDALKETLQIRLIERLRENESGVYSPSVRVNTGRFPESRYNLIVSFGCAPQNVDKLIASVNDEIRKLREDGPLTVNLDKYKAESARQMESELKTNSFWIGYLSGQLQNRQPFEQINDYPKMINSITIEGVKNMARKCLSGNNYIKFVLLPEQQTGY